MRAFAAIDLVADLALGIGDEQAPLGPLHEDDEPDQPTANTAKSRSSSGLVAPVRADSNAWPNKLGKARDDAGEDDQRDAVADAAAGDLLADPHQKNGAAGQRDHGGDAEEEAGMDDDIAPMFQPDGDAIGLDRGQRRPCRSGYIG